MKNANKQTDTIESVSLPKIIDRLLLTEWYGIKSRTLRYRFEEVGLKIKHRHFSEMDVAIIFSKLGLPRFLPTDLKDWALSLIATYCHLLPFAAT